MRCYRRATGGSLWAALGGRMWLCCARRESGARAGEGSRPDARGCGGLERAAGAAVQRRISSAAWGRWLLRHCAPGRALGIPGESGCHFPGKLRSLIIIAYGVADMERMVAMAEECGKGFYYHGEGRGEAERREVERLRLVGPVCVARVTARFVDEAEVVRELEARLR